MNSTLMDEAVDALATHGTQAKAAAALGIPRTTLVSRLEAAARTRRNQASDREKLAQANDRIRKLETILEAQARSIDNQRTGRVKLPIGKRPSRPSTKGNFCRIIIPDTHGCAVNTAAINSLLADIEHVRPTEIIFLGDQIECGGFLAEHHVMGYVAQTEYSFENDVAAANQLLDEVQARAPHAKIEMLEGNHERRLETWVCTQTRRHNKDAKWLRQLVAPEVVLHCEKRGISYYNQGRFYDGLPIPATIKRGKCYFTHGEFTTIHSAAKHVQKYGANIVFGHTHRADSFVIRTVSQGVIGAWNPGCLCELQPLWRHTAFTDWSHGYGLQLVDPDGSFLHVNVPIIEGRSYLSPLLHSIGRKAS